MKKSELPFGGHFNPRDCCRDKLRADFDLNEGAVVFHARWLRCAGALQVVVHDAVLVERRRLDDMSLLCLSTCAWPVALRFERIIVLKYLYFDSSRK